ncbi:IS701 family transposase [Streptomyces sp. NPDC056528]|uniref:IS701 family transposase n=1 Tax=Streptomyces sp. NPDC056528 TaxID=3345854 RepID=UPI003681C5DB
MNGTAMSGRPPSATAVDDAVTDALCAAVFASLPRRDQRDRARRYIEGLLTTGGRKSFRNMAIQLGGGDRLEQRLHHFVSCSTWDWEAVRLALTDEMRRHVPTEAWVLRSLLIPKDANETVGVHRRYVPGPGRMLDVQYAVGLWSASTTAIHPLDWRLVLPRVWTDDPGRRARVALPPGSRAETPGGCAVRMYLDAAEWRPTGPPARPVVVDVEGADVVGLIQQLRASRVPFLVKTDRGVPLTLVEQDSPRPSSRPRPCHRILEATTPSGPSGPDGVVAAARVRSPLRAVRRGGADDARRDERPEAGRGRSPDADDLLLIGDRDGRGCPTGAVWLTDMLDVDVPRLTALTALARRTDAALAATAVPLGIKDFTGRTYDGWNRHATLVSVAHCATALSAPAR